MVGWHVLTRAVREGVSSWDTLHEGYLQTTPRSTPDGLRAVLSHDKSSTIWAIEGAVPVIETVYLVLFRLTEMTSCVSSERVPIGY